MFRRSWPLLVALVVIVVHLTYLWPGGAWTRRPGPLVLGQDEGTVLYDSYRIATGQVMYRDFFEFQGPVFYYLHAGLFKIVGPSLTAARMVGLLITALGSALLALLVARFAGRAAGVGAAMIHAFLLVPMWPFDYPHWLAETLTLAALVLVVRDQPCRWRLLGAGACFALAAFTIQSVGLPVLIAALLLSIGPGLAARGLRLALGPPLLLLGGAAVPTAVILGYFAAAGALGDLGYAMFVWTVKHYPLGQGAATAFGWGMAESLRDHQQVLRGLERALGMLGIRIAFLLPFFALVAAVYSAVRGLAKLWRRQPGGWDGITAAGVSLAAVAPLWLAPVRPDLVHIAVLGSFGLIGAAVLAAPARGRARTMVSAAFVLVGLVCGASYLAKTVRTWAPSRAMGDWREETLKLTEARRIDSVTPADQSIVVGAMGGFYYLYLRPAAVPNTYIPATLPRYLSEAQWQRIADAIVAARPGSMLFFGTQWDELRKRRPELDRLYRRDGGLLLLANSSALPRPSVNSTPSGSARKGE